MKKIVLATFVALVCPLSLASRAEPVGVALAVQKAILKNPEVLAKVHALDSAGSDQDVAWGGYLPKVDASVYGGRERRMTPSTPWTTYNHPGYQVQLRQMLFDGFLTASEVKRLGFAKLSRYYELLQTADETAYEAVRAYLDVQRYSELTTLAGDNYKTHLEIHKQIEDRVIAGVGRRVDLEQATGRRALANSNWLIEQSNLHDVSRRYERIVGELPQAPLAVVNAPTSHLPLQDDVIAVSLAESPSFRAAVAQVRSRRAEVESKRASHYPTLEFRASSGTDKNLQGVTGDTRQNSLQVVLNYNLFNGGSDQARVRSAEGLYHAALDIRDKTCRDLRQQVSIAWNDIGKLREKLGYREQHRLSIEKARAAYRQQFDIGQRTLLDLLDTENEYFEASREVVAARYDLLQAEFRVLAHAHRILPALALQPMAAEAPKESRRFDEASDAAISCSTEMSDVIPANLKMTSTAPETTGAAAAPAASGWLIQPPGSETAPQAQPVVAPSEGKSVEENGAVEAVVKSWAEAWSSKDIAAYLSHYSKDFKPGKGQSRTAWERKRRQMLTKQGAIQVTISSLQLLPEGNLMKASFEQGYVSAGYSDRVQKTLQLRQEAGAWRILEEISRPLP